MSVPQEQRPSGLLMAVFAVILTASGCSQSGTTGGSASLQSASSGTTGTDSAGQFTVINTEPGLTEVAASPTDPQGLSPEEILSNLDDARRFVESLEEESTTTGFTSLPEPNGGLVSSEATELLAVELEDDGQVLVVESAVDSTPSGSSARTPSTEEAQQDPLPALIKSLMKTASESDAPLKQHLALAVVFAWVAPEKPFEPQGLSELTDEERQLVDIVYRRFKQLGTELEEGGNSAALASAFGEVISRIDAESPFRINRMRLCSAVRDFGDVDVFDPPMFSPSERSKFIWYVELDGADPLFEESTESYGHEFMVRTEMFSTETGVPVVPPVENTVRHASSSRIRDLFLRNVFEIPESLQYGWYTVKITVSEQHSGSQAQMGLDLLWVPSLAAGTEHFERKVTTAVIE